MRKIFKLLTFLKNYPLLVMAIIITSIIGALLEGVGVSMLTPFIISIFSKDSFSQTANSFINFMMKFFIAIPVVQRLQVISFIILGAILFKHLFLYASKVLTGLLEYRLRRDLISKLYNQLLTVDYRFILRHKEGEFLTWFSQEVMRASLALSMLIMQFSEACVVAIYALLLMLLSWKVVVAGIGLLLVLVSAITVLTKSMHRRGEEISKTGKEITSYWIEALAGMRTIRIFGQEEYESRRHAAIWKRFNLSMFKKAMLNSLLNPASEVVITVILVIYLILFAPVVVKEASLYLPVLLTFLYVLFRLQNRVGAFNSFRTEMASNLAAVETVTEALRQDNKPYLSAGKKVFSGLKDGIKFENLTFAYNNAGLEVIKGATFDIPKGKTIALIGSSGTGKTTLVDLLLRFYDPQAGRILIDGIDLREFNLYSWRKGIGMVSQSIFVFNASVADNIRYGKLDATQEEIVAAAKAAFADEFILGLPQGYDTLIGDRGARLSGGECQRIAIARAIIRNPEILILDEATSALDTESEKSVQKAINQVCRGRTVLVIAHRLSTVENADQLLILEDGVIAEQGTHEELLKKNGRYVELYRLQYRKALEKINKDIYS